MLQLLDKAWSHWRLKVDSSSPQSACPEPAVLCTGLGLPGFCIHGQPAQLSELLRPKISEGGSRNGKQKVIKAHKKRKGKKKRHSQCGSSQQNVLWAIYRRLQASCGVATLSLCSADAYSGTNPSTVFNIFFRQSGKRQKDRLITSMFS